MQQPLVPVTIALIMGIATGYFLHIPAPPLLAVLILILFILLVPAIRKRKGFSSALAVAAFFILGITNINLSLYGTPESSHILYQINREKLTMTCVIIEDPQKSPDGTVIIVAARSIIRGNEILPAEGIVMLFLPSIDYPLKYGDLLRVRTRLRKPRNFHNPGSFDYEKRLLGRGILVQGRVGSASDVVLIREGQGNILRIKLERFRAHLRKIIEDNAATPQREILTALLLGDTKQIPTPVRESFNRTGTSHILAISGLHVGTIASLSILLALFVMKTSPFLLLRFNIIKVSSFIALIPVLVYTFIAGLGVSVVRATIMIMVFLVAVLIRKERDLFNTLALAALIILLLNPPALFNVSFQLSFTAVSALIFAAPLFSAFLNQSKQEGGKERLSRPRRIINNLLLFIFVSLTATLGTLPLIAFYFNGISTVSLPANLIVVPLMGMITLPLGMAVIVTAPCCAAISAFLVKVASFFVGISLTAINHLSSLPGSYLTVVTPSLPEIVCYYLLLIIMVIFASRNTGKGLPETSNPFLSPVILKYIFWALLIFLAADYSYFFFRDKFRSGLQITAIDVGQGSATLIRLPKGSNMLVDGGGNPGGGTFDVGENVLAPYLWKEGIKQLDLVVLTHPHPDHLQGLLPVLENFPVREVWTNGAADGSELYANFLEMIEKNGIVHRIVGAETAPVRINGVTIRVLNPQASLVKSNKKQDDFDATNNSSLVLKVVFGRISFLLAGDISGLSEKILIDSGTDLQSDVLYVPHHGGFASSTPLFLRRVKPGTAVISCGYDNIFRLPHPDVLKRYANLPARVYRTDVNGAVTIATDGQELAVTTTIGK